MQLERFEHFAADNHSCFLTDCSITLIDKKMVQIPQEEKSTRERF